MILLACLKQYVVNGIALGDVKVGLVQNDTVVRDIIRLCIVFERIAADTEGDCACRVALFLYVLIAFLAFKIGQQDEQDACRREDRYRDIVLFIALFQQEQDACRDECRCDEDSDCIGLVAAFIGW